VPRLPPPIRRRPYPIPNPGRSVVRQTNQTQRGGVNLALARQVTFDLLQLELELQLQQQLALRLALLQKLDLLVRRLSDLPGPELRSKLTDDNPEVRWAAAQVIGRRRLPLQPELIARLDDRDPDVRQSARQALVRLSRGTDFGPLPDAPRRLRRHAVDRWRTWLALQDAVTEDATVRPTAEVIAKLSAAGAALPRDARIQEAAGREGRLASELLAATGAKQEAVLKRLRESEGDHADEALALAIPSLASPGQGRAREALAGRLARLSADELRKKFKDEEGEVRRAAASACLSSAAKELVPELLALLDDPEEPVAQAARASLKGFTGEDFGPKVGAKRGERVLARAAWHGWWLKHQPKKK
jgi:HEAT repeat protein